MIIAFELVMVVCLVSDVIEHQASMGAGAVVWHLALAVWLGMDAIDRMVADEVRRAAP